MILFVGSPAQADPAALVKLGQALKKNNVAVDVVSFGEVEENQEKLEAFVKAVNSNDNSNLVVVPPGTRTLTDVIRSSPMSGRAAAGGEGGRAAEDEEFGGIDPNEDPELAMAIRASLEEEKRRREREQKEKGEGETPHEATMTEAVVTDDDEEAMLAEAIALSMQAQTSQPTTTQATEPEKLTAEPAPQATATTTTTATQTQQAGAGGEEVTDPQFLNEILASLPGVDPNDPQIQQILEGMRASQQGEKKEGEK